MTTQTLIRLVVGLGMTAIVGAFALRRVWWLYKLIMSGQPASDRTDNIGTRIWTEIAEVFGQRRLLKWSIPGLAHFFTMWGFFILLTVYIEAYGLLFQPNFHIPIIGRWDALGFLQDFFATAVFLGIVTFAIIRLRTEPKEYGRGSRFYGSHTGGAWLILFMIFNVIWTYVLVRGSAVNNGTLPYGKGAFLSQLFGAILRPLGHTGNEILETVALLLHIGVMLAFLIIVLHSKHLHIFLAPINVVFKRLPDGLARCCRSRPTASRSISKTRLTTRNSAAARSKTSRGRACSISPPAPNVGAASRSARRGTPASRCPRNSSSWTCGITGWPKRHTCWARRTPQRRAATSNPVAANTITFPNPDSAGCPAPGPSRRIDPWSVPRNRAASSIPTCCGRA
ncbi:putative membrane protein [Mycobacterium kansasii 824]|nr:putative membrane protein [Mycobacterium kansasii 824]